MTKKQILLKLSAYKLLIGIICLTALVGGVYVVKAYQNDEAPKVIVEGDYIEAPSVEVAQTPVKPMIGAVSSEQHMGKLVCMNDDCTYHIQQTFQDATTTIVSFPNPFRLATSTTDGVVIYTDDGGKGYTGATTSVDLARLIITGAATSSFQLECGASASAYTAPTYDIVTTTVFAIATSSVGVIENDLLAAVGGLVNAGSVDKIMMTQSYPYFTCVVEAIDNTAFTNGDNTFDGEIMVRLNKQR